MITLVLGGSGSGKSEYAEQLICSKTEFGKRIYIATMIAYGEEGKKRVERHRSLRAGKGFVTVEQPTDIGALLENKDILQQGVLLECMSNLVANEMFSEDSIKPEKEVVDKITKDMHVLCREIEQVVIVSNNVFEDGILYDESTMTYLSAIGKINRNLAKMADEVVLLSCGVAEKVKKLM